MGELERIRGDLYDISSRLTEIDSGYELYRNKRLNRYEVRKGGALQIAVPFAELDARTLELARKTRIENAARLIAEIERDNERLERAKQREICEQALAASQV